MTIFYETYKLDEQEVKADLQALIPHDAHDISRSEWLAKALTIFSERAITTFGVKMGSGQLQDLIDENFAEIRMDYTELIRDCSTNCAGGEEKLDRVDGFGRTVLSHCTLNNDSEDDWDEFHEVDLLTISFKVLQLSMIYEAIFIEAEKFMLREMEEERDRV